jgi:hypothetical protein
MKVLLYTDLPRVTSRVRVTLPTMSPAYTIGPDAYYKIFFHVAKHPHKSVNGVLLGNQDHPGSAVEITDAVPLLHHWTSLSPMMEIGLDLV